MNPNRWYDPSVGRWLSEDPSGLAAGDANLYRYCDNGPTDATDPTGMGEKPSEGGDAEPLESRTMDTPIVITTVSGGKRTEYKESKEPSLWAPSAPGQDRPILGRVSLDRPSLAFTLKTEKDTDGSCSLSLWDLNVSLKIELASDNAGSVPFFGKVEVSDQLFKQVRYHEYLHAIAYWNVLRHVAQDVRKVNEALADLPKEVQAKKVGELNDKLQKLGESFLSDRLAVESDRQVRHLDHLEEHRLEVVTDKSGKGLAKKVLKRGEVTYGMEGQTQELLNTGRSYAAKLTSQKLTVQTHVQAIAAINAYAKQLDDDFDKKVKELIEDTKK
jgi:hypothetical protein